LPKKQKWDSKKENLAIGSFFYLHFVLRKEHIHEIRNIFSTFKTCKKCRTPRPHKHTVGASHPLDFLRGGRGSKNICTFVQIMRWVVRKFRFFPWKNCLYDWKYHLGQKFCFSKRGWILGGSMYYLYPHYPIPIPVVPMYAHKVTASQFTKFWYLDKNISSVWAMNYNCLHSDW